MDPISTAISGNDFLNTLYGNISDIKWRQPSFRVERRAFTKHRIYKCNDDDHLIDNNGWIRHINDNEEMCFEEVAFTLEPITHRFIEKWIKYGIQFEFAPSHFTLDDDATLLVKCVCTSEKDDFRMAMMLPYGDQSYMIQQAFKKAQPYFKASILLTSAIRQKYNLTVDMFNSPLGDGHCITINKRKKKFSYDFETASLERCF